MVRDIRGYICEYSLYIKLFEILTYPYIYIYIYIYLHPGKFKFFQAKSKNALTTARKIKFILIL